MYDNTNIVSTIDATLLPTGSLYSSYMIFRVQKLEDSVIFRCLNHMLYPPLVARYVFSVYTTRDKLLLTGAISQIANVANTWCYAELILGLRPANERRRYKVTPSLIDWAQT